MKLKYLFGDFLRLIHLKKKRTKWSKPARNLPSLYDEHNNPIMPPSGSRYSKKIRHKIQRPSLFTEKETKEILEKQSQ